MQINTIAGLINYGQQQLAQRSDSAKLDAQILLGFVLDKARSYLLTWPEKTLPKTNVQHYLYLLQRRIAGEPIAYIVGVQEFWSLPFRVSPATLIPRPDTEVLVELVLEHFAQHNTLHCLDLGTGTGAIALALASEQPHWTIDAVDFSHDAVALAKQNAVDLGLSQVNIFHSNWFSAVNERTYDVIVSNPPYIDVLDKHLHEGDVRYEPESALVADEQGFGDIKHIAQQARGFLSSQGALFFEHGFEQAEGVRKLLTTLGYANAQTVKDFNGHDRITWATYKIAN